MAVSESDIRESSKQKQSPGGGVVGGRGDGGGDTGIKAVFGGEGGAARETMVLLPAWRPRREADRARPDADSKLDTPDAPDGRHQPR